MTFNPRVWFPIAVVVSAINVVAVGHAAAAAEPWHAAIHAALAVAFGWWAQRLRPGPDGGTVPDRLGELEAEMSRLRQELGEAHERLDFAERVLAQGQEARRPDQQR